MTVKPDILPETLAADPFFEPIGHIRTVFDAIQVMRKACNLYRFSIFSVLNLPNAKPGAPELLSKMAIISSWPPEMIGDYDRLGLGNDSPVFRRLRTRIAPLVFKVDDINNMRSTTESVNNASELFGRYGLTMGVYYPVYDSHGQRFSVSFMGDRDPMAPNEILTLAMFSTLIVEQLSKISAIENSGRTDLNSREIEVLQWIAEGKTSSEIAKITGLSEHTVNHYATIATQKLGCSNRTQAVVRAIRLGVFD
ncbi:MAG: LuxR C-terminal-related transcriptional regulator [Hoeflea sp.]|uniref:helix-turn-helix transcriptional regulator n=1 Tax=Hoeflea sp. TaxID=1940281 RepID=UPI0032ED7141